MLKIVRVEPLKPLRRRVVESTSCIIASPIVGVTHGCQHGSGCCPCFGIVEAGHSLGNLALMELN